MASTQSRMASGDSRAVWSSTIHGSTSAPRCSGTRARVTARSCEGIAMPWPSRRSAAVPGQPSIARSLSRRACLPVSACSTGETGRRRSPANQRPRPSRRRCALTSSTRMPRSRWTMTRSLSPSRVGPPGVRWSTQRQLRTMRKSSGRAARRRSKTCRSAASPASIAGVARARAAGGGAAGRVAEGAPGLDAMGCVPYR